MYPNIKAERRRLGWSQDELAERLGVACGTVGHWERGGHDIPAAFLIAMARLFNCSTDYLLGLRDRAE